MATRRTSKAAQPEVAPTEEVATTDITETDAMTDVVDDVVETDASDSAEPAKRGRKPDPVKAATARFSDAKKALDEASKPRPSVEDAQAEYNAARDQLASIMGL